jgi:predicted enzyme related to lactoylglutathione lyase
MMKAYPREDTAMVADSHGAIWWNELNTRDPAAARAFCERLYGWDIEAMPMPEGGTYLVCKKDGAPVAGIFDLGARDRLPPPCRPTG